LAVTALVSTTTVDDETAITTKPAGSAEQDAGDADDAQAAEVPRRG
jgi:hypothetical protein